MMSRVMLLGACLALAASETFKIQCDRSNTQPSCSSVCCCAGWELVADASGLLSCQQGGTVCSLCGQDANACDFGSDLCSPSATVEDTLGNALTPAPAPAGISAASSSSSGLLSPTTPSSGVTLTLGTYNGMSGWQDIPASTFANFRGFLVGLTATVPSFYTAGGYTVKYSCKKGSIAGAPAKFAACDIFLFVYRCPPCEAQTSGIGAQLLAMSSPKWYADFCGPTFQLNADTGADHQFAMYHAELKDGETASVLTQGPVEFMFWAMVGKSVICSAKADKAACGAASDNCAWFGDALECRPRTCERGALYHGPPTPKCQVCTSDESDFIPDVIGA